MVVIAAVDRSDRAKRAVLEAVEIAEAFAEPVHVVHVIKQSEFLELERAELNKSGRPVEMDRIRKHAAKLAEEVSAGAADDAAVDVEYVGLVGDAADQIVNYAADQDARYMVVGPRRRSPTGKVLFGSTSQEILLNADRPVLVTMSE